MDKSLRVLNFDTSDLPDLNRADSFFNELHSQVDMIHNLFNNLYEADNANIYQVDACLSTIFDLQGALIRGDL